MGNEKSTLQHKKPEASTSSAKQDKRISDAFHRLTSSDKISLSDLQTEFGDDLAECLWDYLSDKRPKDQGIGVEEFKKRAYPLLGDNGSFYATFCHPERRLIKICSESAGAAAVEGDEKFIAALEADLAKKNDSHADIQTWINQDAPRLCEGLQSVVQNKLCGYPKIVHDYESDILSPLEMWFVKCSLPVIYFPKVEAGEMLHWTPLYTSAMQGISINRFDANVIDYRGPTVSIFQMTDKRKFVLAADQEWRHSGNRFGGPNTLFMQLSPTIMRIQNGINAIYCNFKMRAASNGISFKEVMKIDKDMSNVESIEVWGCAGANTLADQQKLKQWQGQQAEKHKKVPLPGNWDDNPDKSIMEMAGFQFSNERQLMEMEAKKRAEQQKNQ